MFQRIWKKWLCHILVAGLVPAVMGMFAFSIAENFDLFYFAQNPAVPDGVFSSLEHDIDWLIEDTVIISGVNGRSRSSPHGGSVRIFMPPGIQSAGTFLVQPPLAAGQKQYFNIKPAILLKLRI
ncbi:MAG: hypothetical protein LBP20_09820 [Treponema sp.]|jgi:hypothetical protein|nr:hypothetical protein [Treponema sp.]